MRHVFQSAKSNGADPTLVDASNWNDNHAWIPRSINSTQNGQASDDWIKATGGSSGINYTTPSIGAGESLMVTKEDTGAGIVQVLPNTGTINDLNAIGASAYLLVNPGQFVILTFDGANFWVTGKN